MNALRREYRNGDLRANGGQLRPRSLAQRQMPEPWKANGQIATLPEGVRAIPPADYAARLLMWPDLGSRGGFRHVGEQDEALWQFRFAWSEPPAILFTLADPW